MVEATIYDVAEKAGVSITTVSRVFNSPDLVNETTRTRILAVIDQLGFVPKAEAVARARKDQGRIGVLAPFFTYPSFVQRLQGVAKALANLPYELVIYNLDTITRRNSYLASIPISRRLDGFIIMSQMLSDEDARRLLNNGLATVLIEYGHPEFNSVEIDNHEGGRLAAQYLVEQGHRRCAFFGDTDIPAFAIPTSDWRLNGYRQFLQEAGLSLPDSYIVLAPHGLEQAYQQAPRFLDLPDPPTAIFAASDTQAMGLLKAMRERGLAVSSNMAIMGFDDVEMAAYLGLTTIRQQLEESGRVAVELLLAHLAEPNRSIQNIKFPLAVIKRQTA